ncbi:MAG: ABC transporter ATP-binding protein [Rhodobacteraceae bacterium]|jgi:peptide/nickel transport system ATP-binding protein|nr:ABC transporter ATP-binding protein [Paracoccaceae bacterium]
MTAVVDVQGLCVRLSATGEEVVSDVTFSIGRGEILGVVGESGSGKTSIGMTLLGYLRKGAEVSAGEIRVDGTDMRRAPEAELRRMRGAVVSYIPQDPAAALSPRLTIGTQLAETLSAHGRKGRDAAARIAAMMRALDLPDDRAFLRKYPHQLSGGQKQRICIGMAFLLNPAVVMLDEPTTGLDVLTQDSVLRTVRRLCADHQVAALYVTHDLPVVAGVAHRVMVMKSGHIVEQGPVAEVFARPQHAYTRELIAAAPDISCRHHFGRAVPAPATATSPAGPPAAPVLRVVGLDAHYDRRQVLHGVALDLAPGECLALVGQSGSGKSTLSRTIIGLHNASAGAIVLDGETLANLARDRTPAQRKRLQYVFQSPFTALNPRRSVAEAIAAPIRTFGETPDRTRIAELLDMVSLSQRVASLYPSDLSGGERQRVAIARAMATDPDVLLCDEITSALDVSVQAAIVRLLKSLQEERQVSMIFVTHNLALVRSLADRVAVMQGGRIVETGPTDRVLDNPEADYTRLLVEITPSMQPAA